LLELFALDNKKRDMRLFLISLFTFLATTLQGQAKVEQDVFVPIAKYMQAGDSEKLSAWFAPESGAGCDGICKCMQQSTGKANS
jgi:hypothetical protein